MSSLKINNLVKTFGSKRAVDGLSFSAEPGQLYCILGHNGAGKTTTFNMLMGFSRPDGGKATFGEYNLWDDRNACREFLFYLPENVNLYPEFTAVENLAYLCALAKVETTDTAIRKALIDTGIRPEFLDVVTRDFSKGMRQKTAIAFAKLKKARLIFLDEPTSGLDPIATREFISLVQQMKAEGSTVVMITHDLRCAHLLADKAGILRSGKLIEELYQKDCTYERLEALYFKAAS